MSRYSEVTDSLIDRYRNNKPLVNGVQLSDSNLKLPNAPFTTPENELWVRLTVINGRGINVQAGKNGTTRATGIFVVDVFVPKGSGNKLANNVADQAVDLYRKQFFDNIRAEETEVVEIGISDAWHQVQMTLFYNFDDC